MASAPNSPPPSPTSSTISSAWAAAGAAAAQAASAAPTCATTWRSRSRKPSPARAPRSGFPTSVTCDACSGSGAKAGTKPKACATCGGQGKIRHAQGFFTLERTCPVVPWPRPGDRPAVHVVRRSRPGDPRADALGQHPVGGRGRNPHPPLRRGRSRGARRPRGRPLYFPFDRARTISSSATAPTCIAARRFP